MCVCVVGVGSPCVCRFAVFWDYYGVGVYVLGVGFGVVVVCAPPKRVYG